MDVSVFQLGSQVSPTLINGKRKKGISLKSLLPRGLDHTHVIHITHIESSGFAAEHRSDQPLMNQQEIPGHNPRTTQQKSHT